MRNAIGYLLGFLVFVAGIPALMWYIHMTFVPFRGVKVKERRRTFEKGFQPENVVQIVYNPTEQVTAEDETMADLKYTE